MSGRDAARQVIDALPDDASVDDIIHALCILVRCERGAREIRDGKGIPHDEARQRRHTHVV